MPTEPGNHSRKRKGRLQRQQPLVWFSGCLRSHPVQETRYEQHPRNHAEPLNQQGYCLYTGRARTLRPHRSPARRRGNPRPAGCARLPPVFVLRKRHGKIYLSRPAPQPQRKRSTTACSPTIWPKCCRLCTTPPSAKPSKNGAATTAVRAPSISTSTAPKPSAPRLKRWVWAQMMLI